MFVNRLAIKCLPLGLAVALVACNRAQSQDPPPQPPGVDVQARGPVHEAFAQPTTPQPAQGAIVPKQPPAPIDELPPDQKPQGDNVQWIPGYWAFDDEASDFIWISGCWRAPPPGQRWMPGHWQEVNGGWLWVSGFWTPEATTEVNYLPAPPPTLEQGPSAAAPDANSIYIPGCWVYSTTRFLWRPGHWIGFRPDWVWVPACYIWTPSGYLFVEGYWDHPLDQRGLLFSPIRFDLRLWLGLRRPFVPEFVIQSDFMMSAMFVCLGNRHFYFGDYYEPMYDRRFVPWCDYHPMARLYDPCFGYYRHIHSVDVNWEPALRQLYAARRSGEVPRPPRTLARQYEAIRGLAASRTEAVAIHKDIRLTQIQNASVLTRIDKIQNVRVTNLAGLGGAKVGPGREWKVAAVSREEREHEVKSAVQIRDIGQMRRESEAKLLHQGGVPVLHTDPPRNLKLELPRPIAPPIVHAPLKEVPARIVPPVHEERPIPKFEPPRPPEPKRK